MNPWLLDGIPYYISHLVGENTIMRFCVGTPDEYVVVDSQKTLDNLIAQFNLLNRAEHA